MSKRRSILGYQTATKGYQQCHLKSTFARVCVRECESGVGGIENDE